MFKIQSSPIHSNVWEIINSETLEIVSQSWDKQSAINHADYLNSFGVGYLQPRNEKVPVRSIGSGEWLARFEGLWRRVHIQVNRTFIVYRGERITIQIEGV